MQVRFTMQIEKAIWTAALIDREKQHNVVYQENGYQNVSTEMQTIVQQNDEGVSKSSNFFN